MPSEKEILEVLSTLTLNPGETTAVLPFIVALDDASRDELVRVADSHHVVIRSMSPVRDVAPEAGYRDLAGWAETVIARENQRIENALIHLQLICNELEAAGCPVAVMKSLDHWPDLGNDLDLYTTAHEQQVVAVFRDKFHAEIEARSWGDRLAHKWNFRIAGLRESVEVHVRRLGQTGEHTAMAERVISRRVRCDFCGSTFYVPAPEERVIVATLQRLYRHFYFRVCDIVNSAALLDGDRIDYGELRRGADMGGIWAGVATYLSVVSDYVAGYRGTPLALPPQVRSAALFGGDIVCPRALFLRVPIMPHGAALFTRQVKQTALRGDLAATFRLSLLPYLASAAAVAYRVTGSDKGIW